MKTYKDGLLEAAKVCERLRKQWMGNPSMDEYDKPTALECAAAIRALAAQEDQRPEAERIADSRSKSSTQSSDHPQQEEGK
jgi:hypothetical protein